jgi:hypothetical protein
VVVVEETASNRKDNLMDAYIVVGHNIKTDEPDWQVFTGRNAFEGATVIAKRWAERKDWVAFVRPVGNPVVIADAEGVRG